MTVTVPETDQIEEAAIEELAKLIDDELWPLFEREKKRAETIDLWLAGGPEIPPRKASREHKTLARMSRTPWLFVVSTVSVQMLLMGGAYCKGRTPESLAGFMEPWDVNRMDSRQTALYRSANDYGIAYAKAMPGEPLPVITVYSPKSMIAVYEDPAQDLYPKWAMDVKPTRKGGFDLTLTDDSFEHEFKRSSSGAIEHVVSRAHGAPECPVIRWTEDMDTEGNSPGELERLIDTAGRLNKTVYDRVLLQHYNSWKIRTATKLDDAISDEESAKFKLKLAQDDILVGTGDMEFGTLGESPIDPFSSAHDSNREDLAAVSQTPLPAVGKMINVGDDGVDAAYTGLRAKTNRRKRGYGQSNMDLLRLCASIVGNDDATNYAIKSQWADVEVVNLSQAADAFGKLAVQLGIPAELLIPKLPNLTEHEAESWVAHMAMNPSPAMIEAQALADQLAASP